MTDSLRRIWGLMYRHLALYRRSWPRVLELIYWPVLQMLIWGFTTSFIVRQAGAQRRHIARLPPPWSSPARCSAACCCGRSRCGARWASRSASSRNYGRAIWVTSSSARSARGRWSPPLLSISILRMLTGVLPAILLAFGPLRLQPLRPRPDRRAVLRQPHGDGLVGGARRRQPDPAPRRPAPKRWHGRSCSG